MEISDWFKSKAGPSSSQRTPSENARPTLTRDESMQENDNWHDMGLDQQEEQVDLDVSFSSRDGSRMESDSVRSFSESEVYVDKAFLEDDVQDSQQTQLTSTENILSGLDKWHPSKGIQSSPSPILSVHDPHDDLFVDDDHSWPSSPMNNEQQQSHVVQDDPIQMPEPPIFESVTPTPSQQMNTHMKPTIKLKKSSVGFKAMQDIIQASKDHEKWLQQVREEVVKKGSIANVCVSSEDAQLFRILQTWVDHGFIFACCTPLSQDEMDYILSTSLGHERNNANLNDDIVEDTYSQPMQLPPYNPDEEDEQFVFMFSFAYMHAPDSTRIKLLQEECVAIWPPWTRKTLLDQDVYIVTRFMSQSIY